MAGRTIAQTAFEQKLANLGVTSESVEDWSDVDEIVMSTPNCAYVNITGVDRMPWSKTNAQSIDMHAMVEVYDMNGHYFTKKVLLNAQGNSSMGFVKKNFALDFCEDEWIGDKTTNIKIGEWVTQDAFHFKAYYLDKFRGTGTVGYWLYDQIVADHESFMERAGFEDNGARCYPDGFPCIVYLNGDFQGVFAWQLKKHRKNMNQTKDVAEHIHLDGTIANATFWNGNVNWTQFEIRNPKKLYGINEVDLLGYAYIEITDDVQALEEMGDNYEEAPSNPKDMDPADLTADSPRYYRYVTSKGKIKFYQLVEQSGKTYELYNGDDPVELIDETMPYYDANDKNHVMTAKTKSYIKNFSKLCGELKALENGGASADEVKAAFENRIDVQGMIDYTVFSAVVNNYDGFYKNWQWFTYDGIKWYVAPYDLDGIFGNYWTGTLIMPADWQNARDVTKFTNMVIMNTGPMYFIDKYYKNDVVARYKELRENNVFTTSNIVSMMRDWATHVGEDNYAEEWNKWPKSPCILDTKINVGWTMEEDWSLYKSVPDYNTSTTYNEGDKCRYQYRVWTAMQTVCGVAPCSQIGYYDGLDRLEEWLDDRFEICDSYCDYVADEMLMSYTLNISSAGWRTLCVPFSFAIPDGIDVFRIDGLDEANNAYAKKTKVLSTEANNSYLIRGNQGRYLLSGIYEDFGMSNLQTGLLIGSYEDTFVPKHGYVLQNQNGVLAFYQVPADDSILLSANRAFLSVPDSEDGARLCYFIDEDSVNPIEYLTNDSNDCIDTIYNLNGAKTESLHSGLNILTFKSKKSCIIVVK